MLSRLFGRGASERQREQAKLSETKLKVASLKAKLEEAKGKIAKLKARRDELETWLNSAVYISDGICAWGKNTSFMDDPRFVEGYRQGVHSGHKYRENPEDLDVRWRAHVICWAASHAAKLPGSFVECGVNTGIFSLTAAHYIDFNATGKNFYLFDTYEGVPVEQMSEEEKALDHESVNRHYWDCYELTKANFAKYPRAQLVRGRVPESLETVNIDRVCYLSVDMNCAAPEVAAMRHFWPRLVPGAIVVFDDYGWLDYKPSKLALDEWVDTVGCKILTVPTGQGVLIKPPVP